MHPLSDPLLYTSDSHSSHINHYDSRSLLLFSDVTWQGQEARLTLHYDNGFTLSDTRPEDGRKSQIFWHFPFEKLRMSADDGIRLLWLDFGEEGEQVIITLLNRVHAHIC